MLGAVVSHLRRDVLYASKGTQVGGRAPRLPTARDLMNEAEKILHKNSGGLSLYERLTRDAQLRKDMLDLLAELEMVESDV